MPYYYLLKGAIQRNPACPLQHDPQEQVCKPRQYSNDVDISDGRVPSACQVRAKWSV